MTDLSSALIDAAIEARKRAYAPYSRFPVGAALLSREGEVFWGANMENVSSGLTVCAERVAAFNAITAGSYHFSTLAVVGDSTEPVFPCGACRQVLWELTGEIEIIAANLKDDVLTVSLSALLPHPFTPDNLTSPRDYFE